jgi:hypothetical protein
MSLAQPKQRARRCAVRQRGADRGVGRRRAQVLDSRAAVGRLRRAGELPPTAELYVVGRSSIRQIQIVNTDTTVEK